MNTLTMLVTLILSIFMIISSTSWFFTWVSLEINLLTFIGWSLKHKYHEAMTKYFLIQSLGSSLFIMTGSMSSLTMFNLSSSHMLILLSMSILIKMGSVPFHLWYPEVMSNINWNQCIMLTTIQKLGPLFILSQLKTNISLFALTSAMFGALSSINQTSLRKLLAFSSISHNGWMLMCISVKMSTWMTYFLIYSMINFITMNLLKQQKWYHLNQMLPINITTKMMVLMSILTLSGLPPTIGFMPKWTMLSTIIFTSTVSGLVLISSSLIIMLAYLTMIYTTMFSTHTTTQSTYPKIKSQLPSILLLTLPSIPLSLL